MRRYLIVDDNKAFAENLAEILRDGGDEAVVAGRGPEALVMVRASRFDALVTDMRMPEMGGAELVHGVRSADPGLPAIAITAYSESADLESARREGLLAVLPKPVPIERLVELLTAARRDAIVALVEDDLALADNLSEALRDRGYSVVTAASVLQTEALAGVRPCAAVVDLRVPGGPDGEAMRRLGERFPGLPFFVITGVDAAPPLPARAVFRKPFDTAELMRSLAGACEACR